MADTEQQMEKSIPSPPNDEAREVIGCCSRCGGYKAGHTYSHPYRFRCWGCISPLEKKRLEIEP